MKVRQFLLAVSLALLAGAVSCSPQSESRLTIALGGTPHEAVLLEEIVRDFSRSTGIDVSLNLQSSDTDQRRQGLLIALQSGMPDPDVFLMDVAWVTQFAASGWLEPLDGLLESAGLDSEVLFRDVVGSVDVYQDHLIALPFFIDAGLLYYRKDLLELHGFDPPQTWEQLVQAAKAVQEKERESNPDFYGFVWQGAQYEGLVCNFLEFSVSNGGGLPVREGKVLADLPANHVALLFMKDLIHLHKVSPPSTYTEFDEEVTRRYFQEGDALFERNWPYAWALHQQPGSKVGDKVGISILPHFEDGRSAAALGGWHAGISRFSDRKEEARQFVAYLLSYEVQKRLAFEMGWNPARRDIYTDEEVLSKFPHFRELRDIFEHAVARPAVPYYTQISEFLQRELNAVLSGEEAVEQAFENAQSAVNRLMKRYGQ